jgi:hypothetical protein
VHKKLNGIILQDAVDYPADGLIHWMKLEVGLRTNLNAEPGRTNQAIPLQANKSSRRNRFESVLNPAPIGSGKMDLEDLI